MKYKIHMGLLNILLDVFDLILTILKVLSFGKLQFLSINFTLWRISTEWLSEYKDDKPDHE